MRIFFHIVHISKCHPYGGFHCYACTMLHVGKSIFDRCYNKSPLVHEHFWCEVSICFGLHMIFHNLGIWCFHLLDESFSHGDLFLISMETLGSKSHISRLDCELFGYEVSIYLCLIKKSCIFYIAIRLYEHSSCGEIILLCLQILFDTRCRMRNVFHWHELEVYFGQDKKSHNTCTWSSWLLINNWRKDDAIVQKPTRIKKYKLLKKVLPDIILGKYLFS